MVGWINRNHSARMSPQNQDIISPEERIYLEGQCGNGVVAIIKYQFDKLCTFVYFNVLVHFNFFASCLPQLKHSFASYRTLLKM